ncbi:hypothetical protein GRH50_07455 [Campylobacter lari]|nr:hypothetical protein [Campylobacter lari]EDP6895661.1 hypothetical protein [Campylobacter lari]
MENNLKNELKLNKKQEKTLKSVAEGIWYRTISPDKNNLYVFYHIYKKNIYQVRMDLTYYSFMDFDIKKILIREVTYHISNNEKNEHYEWFGLPSRCLNGLNSADSLYKRLKRDIDNIIKNKRKSIYDVVKNL